VGAIAAMDGALRTRTRFPADGDESALPCACLRAHSLDLGYHRAESHFMMTYFSLTIPALSHDRADAAATRAPARCSR
jgi:hypothetical protein